MKSKFHDEELKMKSLFRYSAVFFYLVLVFNQTVASATTADKSCIIEASGEACIFDITANGSGPLTVCTTARRANDRWRASTVQVNTLGAVSNIGTGSTTTCTGSVTRNVVSGVQYEVLATYERPLPGTFPASVAVHFDGPFSSISNYRPLSIVELKSCQQITETTAALAAVDEESIACGALIQCRLDPFADTDSFKFVAAAGYGVNIRVTESTEVNGCTGWTLYPPNGLPIDNNLGYCEKSKDVPNLPGSGNYRIVVSNTTNSIGSYVLSFQGISQSSQCGTALSYGNVKTGRLEVKGDSDAFSFVGLASQTVNVKVTESAAVVGCTGWTLYAPGGTSIGNNLSYCEQSKNVSLPASGTYTIIVSNDANSAINYSILATKVAGP